MPRLREHKWDQFAQHTLDRYYRDRPQVLAVDTETTGLTWGDTPFGMSVSWTGRERIESGWFELEDPEPFQMAERLLANHVNSGGPLVFFNAKFDLRMLANFSLIDQGSVLFPYVDVMPAVALLDPTGEHKLKVSARKYLGVTTNQENLVKQARKELKLTRDDGYWPLPREVVVPYALRDTEYTLRLHDMLMPMIFERGLQEAFDKEMRIVAEFLRMERRGLRVLPEKVRESIRESDSYIEKARAEIEALVGRKVGKAKSKVKVPNGTSEKTGRELFKTVEVPLDFNPASPVQVLEVFKERGVTLSSTESKVLEKVDDPLVEPLLTLRSEEKLRGTYLVPLLKEMDEDHIVHPNLNSNGTATGRASSGAVRET
jgi:DNA polymerase I-like protein with 3'-5' exonuclease and polymerase domains